MNLLNIWKTLRSLQGETLIILVALTTLGVVSHLVSHSAGISTARAIGMMAAALLPRLGRKFQCRHLAVLPFLLKGLLANVVFGGIGVAGTGQHAKRQTAISLD